MSLQKLASLRKDDPKDQRIIDQITKFHGNNCTVPQGMRKADPLCNLGQLGSYTPLAVEYRQLRKPDDPKAYWPFGDDPCAYGHYWFFHDQTGIAYLFTGSHNKPERSWYLFGCDHAMGNRKNIGNCLNVYTCTKCGYSETIDSSD